MIEASTLARITTRAGEIDLSEAGMAHMRREWPGIHFTLCSEDDVPARLQPVAQGQGFSVYLVSNAQHCVAFTDRLESATGLVLAVDSDNR